jgi:hypothetical protein
MKDGLDDVVGKTIQKEIWSVRRNESVVKKANLLLAICKPPGNGHEAHLLAEHVDVLLQNDARDLRAANRYDGVYVPAGSKGVRSTMARTKEELVPIL